MKTDASARGTAGIIALLALACGCSHPQPTQPLIVGEGTSDAPTTYRIWQSLPRQTVPACELERRFQEAITALPRDATKCGPVRGMEPTATVDDCVLGQIEKGRPFWARYDPQGIDSEIATLITSAGAGEIQILHWDSAGCGGDGCPSTLKVVRCLDVRPRRKGEERQVGSAPIVCRKVSGVRISCPQGT